MRIPSLILALVLTGATAAGAAAQKPHAKAAADSAKAKARPEPKLAFEREVYTYPGARRRDPYTPVTGDLSGPRFEDLTLSGIIFSSDPSRSLLLLADASTKKVYRARRGDQVGNARVVEISPARAVFAVDNFGVVRQELLELKRKPEGAKE